MFALKSTLAASVATLALAVVPTIASAADVCNEAENSFRGGYSVTGGPVDPNPPAFLRGSQMRVGNGKGVGLVNAASHSPALRTCGPTVTGGGTGGDTGGGGTGGDPVVDN